MGALMIVKNNFLRMKSTPLGLKLDKEQRDMLLLRKLMVCGCMGSSVSHACKVTANK